MDFQSKMPIVIRELDPETITGEHIEEVIRLSHGEAMVPITQSTIFKHHLAHLALYEEPNQRTQFAGYAAVTHVYSPHVVEIGALMVNENFRGQGIAQELVRHVKKRAHTVWPDAQLLAFTNQVSRSLFTQLGGEQIADPSALPAAVWKICEACTSYERCVVQLGQQCCGRVFDLTAISEY